jgi:hypothetical protein
VNFAPDTRMDPARLVELVHTQPDRFKLTGPTRLAIAWHAGPGVTVPALLEAALLELGADTARLEAAA